LPREALRANGATAPIGLSGMTVWHIGM
jgi:hypothetical protein